MASERKQAAVDENKGLELDSQLWRELPEVLLEMVIRKLPFARLVAFRSVCKDWYSDIIPRAAPHIQASNAPALLCFGHKEFHWKDAESKGSAWWFQLCNSKSDIAAAIEEFQLSSFPIPRIGEDVLLMCSQEGLLFFGLRNRKNSMVRDIVVCNPLTAQSKSLGLPCPLLRSPLANDNVLLFGVVYDTKTGSYSLVAAGVNGTGGHFTFVYDSSSSAWMNGPSVLPTLLEAGHAWHHLAFASREGVSCNGNLYWTITQRREYVIKFDLLKGTWRIMSLELDLGCIQLGSWQMVTYEGDILLWHLHARCGAHIVEHDINSVQQLFDQNYVRYPQRIMWPCRYDLDQGLDPELKLMHHYMVERLDGFLAIEEKLGRNLAFSHRNYLAFRHQNFMYHVFVLYSWPAPRKVHLSLKVVIHDLDKNSYTEFPTVPEEMFPVNHRIFSADVWSFSPSLTSLP